MQSCWLFAVQRKLSCRLNHSSMQCIIAYVRPDRVVGGAVCYLGTLRTPTSTCLHACMAGQPTVVGSLHCATRAAGTTHETDPPAISLAALRSATWTTFRGRLPYPYDTNCSHVSDSVSGYSRRPSTMSVVRFSYANHRLHGNPDFLLFGGIRSFAPATHTCV